MIGFQTSINNSFTLFEEITFAVQQNIKLFDIFFDQWLPSSITKEELSLVNELNNKDFSFTVHTPINYHLLSKAEKNEVIVFIKNIQPKTTTIHFDKITLEELEYLYSEVKDITKISIENTIPDVECKNYLAFLQKTKEIGTFYATLDVGHSFVNGLEPHLLAEKIHSMNIEISTVHAHDNDGIKDMHMTVGKGSINFDKFFKTLLELKQEPYIVIEHWDNNIQSFNNLKKFYHK